MEGIITKGIAIHQSRVAVKPIEHHYEEPGEKPYIKYGCPVCECVGLKHQVHPGEERCFACGVSLYWETNNEE